jgi:hypothetical protein
LRSRNNPARYSQQSFSSDIYAQNRWTEISPWQNTPHGFLTVHYLSHYSKGTYFTFLSPSPEDLLVTHEGVSKSFRTESIKKSTTTTTTTTNARWEVTQRVMAAKLTRLTHKIAIQVLLMAESFTVSSSRSRRPVRKLLDTPSYIYVVKPVNCGLDDLHSILVRTVQITFLFYHLVQDERWSLFSNYILIQSISVTFYPGIKRLAGEADFSHPLIQWLRMRGYLPPSPHTPLGQRTNFILLL